MRPPADRSRRAPRSRPPLRVGPARARGTDRRRPRPCPPGVAAAPRCRPGSSVTWLASSQDVFDELDEGVALRLVSEHPADVPTRSSNQLVSTSPLPSSSPSAVASAATSPRVEASTVTARPPGRPDAEPWGVTVSVWPSMAIAPGMRREPSTSNPDCNAMPCARSAAPARRRRSPPLPTGRRAGRARVAAPRSSPASGPGRPGCRRRTGRGSARGRSRRSPGSVRRARARIHHDLRLVEMDQHLVPAVFPDHLRGWRLSGGSVCRRRAPRRPATAQRPRRSRWAGRDGPAGSA